MFNGKLFLVLNSLMLIMISIMSASHLGKKNDEIPKVVSEENQERFMSKKLELLKQSNLDGKNRIDKELSRLEIMLKDKSRPSLIMFAEVMKTLLKETETTILLELLRSKAQNIINLIKNSKLEDDEKLKILTILFNIHRELMILGDTEKLGQILQEKVAAMDKNKLEQARLMIQRNEEQKSKQVYLVILTFIFALISTGLSILSFKHKESKNNNQVSPHPLKSETGPQSQELLLLTFYQRFSKDHFSLWVDQAIMGEKIDLLNGLLFNFLKANVPNSEKQVIFYTATKLGTKINLMLMLDTPLVNQSGLEYKLLLDYLKSIGGTIDFSIVPQSKITIRISE